MRFARLFLPFAFVWPLCCGQIARAESITIWGGDPTSGGFGDLATNLLMAQNLKGLLPKSEITLVVPKRDDAISMFSQLGVLPGTSLPSGVRVELENAHPPPSDFLLSFSEQLPPPQALRSAARQQFSFLEYGNRARSWATETAWSTTTDRFGQMQHKPEDKPFFGGSAGPSSNSLGLYTTPQAPPTNSKAIAQVQTLSKKPVPKLGPGVRVGFAYSNQAEINQRYLKGIAQFAQKQTAKVVVFTNHSPPTGLEVPPNLEIVVAPKMPFEATQALMARADLPVLVTGDVSLTLALQHNKTPIYETFEHKIDLVGDLRTQLTELNPQLAKPEFADLLKTAFPDLLDVKNWKSDTIAQIASNKDFQTELQSAIGALKDKSSLPVFVAKMVSQWDALGLAGLKKSERESSIARILPADAHSISRPTPLWLKSKDEIVTLLANAKNKTELAAILEDISRWRTDGDTEVLVESYLLREPYGSRSLPTKIKTCRESFARLGKKVRVPDIY